MPGPKMGPRPRDFDEELVRRSPTFRKWENLMQGAKLRYACREFVKGRGDDEERLMRRIMIARRNNVRDHQALKWARRMQSSVLAKEAETPGDSLEDPKGSAEKASKGMEDSAEANNYHAIGNSRRETEAIISRTSHLLQGNQDPLPVRRSRRPTTLISDEAIREEMDVHAVEATRSYKTWLSLPDGAEFLYNQKYIKGQECHDWLLKKNIWRRMRYRRENKKMIEQMVSRERGQSPMVAQQQLRKRRRLEESIIASTAATTVNNNNPLDRILVGASAQNPSTAAATSAAQSNASSRNETNRQEAVASTASEIVDHALLSTNTGGVVPSPAIVPATGSGISISIGQQQQQQQIQDPLPQHHHDAAESAAAFAASIALAGVGIGTDGDLNAHQEVADSAAVEAAVAAALAATDVKSNTYHHHHHHHNLTLTDPSELSLEVNHVVHHASSNNGNPEPSEPPTNPENGMAMGLALDAAAKLAAAAATAASDEAVLAATNAITAAEEAKSGEGVNNAAV